MAAHGTRGQETVTASKSRGLARRSIIVSVVPIRVKLWSRCNGESAKRMGQIRRTTEMRRALVPEAKRGLAPEIDVPGARYPAQLEQLTGQ